MNEQKQGRRRIVGLVAMLAMAITQVRAFEPQVQDDLFAGAEKFAVGAKGSTEINLDKKMLALAGKGDDKDGMAGKMDFVIVRSYEYEKAGLYKMADVEAFTKRLETGGWSHIVKTRSATETTDICVRSNNEGQVSELVVIAGEPKVLTFVHLKGHLTMNDLMKTGGKYGVPDAEAKHDPKLQKR